MAEEKRKHTQIANFTSTWTGLDTGEMLKTARKMKADARKRLEESAKMHRELAERTRKLPMATMEDRVIANLYDEIARIREDQIRRMDSF